MIPIPSGRSGLAGDGPHRHAQRIHGLALIVQETLKRNPHSGHLFVFRGRRGQRPTFCI